MLKKDLRRLVRSAVHNAVDVNLHLVTFVSIGTSKQEFHENKNRSRVWSAIASLLTFLNLKPCLLLFKVTYLLESFNYYKLLSFLVYE